MGSASMIFTHLRSTGKYSSRRRTCRMTRNRHPSRFWFSIVFCSEGLVVSFTTSSISERSRAPKEGTPSPRWDSDFSATWKSFSTRGTYCRFLMPPFSPEYSSKRRSTSERRPPRAGIPGVRRPGPASGLSLPRGALRCVFFPRAVEGVGPASSEGTGDGEGAADLLCCSCAGRPALTALGPAPRPSSSLVANSTAGRLRAGVTSATRVGMFASFSDAAMAWASWSS
mmetsp:Transcript_6603/g.23302  ORF Transcript_6603/g.23302 Transcript_6603/m.23302 type:complete len:227 (-) Transcript_6603:936-1616(-)